MSQSTYLLERARRIRDEAGILNEIAMLSDDQELSLLSTQLETVAARLKEIAKRITDDPFNFRT